MIVNAICTRKDPQSVLSQNIESIIANMDCIKEYVSESDRVRIDMNLILWASSDKRNKYLNEIVMDLQMTTVLTHTYICTVSSGLAVDDTVSNLRLLWGRCAFIKVSRVKP